MDTLRAGPAGHRAAESSEKMVPEPATLGPRCHPAASGLLPRSRSPGRATPEARRRLPRGRCSKKRTHARVPGGPAGGRQPRARGWGPRSRSREAPAAAGQPTRQRGRLPPGPGRHPEGLRAARQAVARATRAPHFLFLPPRGQSEAGLEAPPRAAGQRRAPAAAAPPPPPRPRAARPPGGWAPRGQREAGPPCGRRKEAEEEEEEAEAAAGSGERAGGGPGKGRSGISGARRRSREPAARE